MPRVSKKRLSEKDIKKFNQYLLNTLSSLTNTTVIDEFLTDFLTHEEKIMLAKRLLIFIMLKRNYKEIVIQSALHVSYETVRTYKNQLRSKSKTFQKVVRDSVKKEEMKEFFDRIDKLLKPLSLALELKRSPKSRAKFAQGDWQED